MNAVSEVGTMTVEATNEADAYIEPTPTHCENCGKLLGVTTRRKYCNMACKQNAYRSRKLTDVTH